MFKHEFDTEEIPVENIDTKYQFYLVRFSSNLSFETVINISIDRQQRLCLQCNMCVTEEPYNFLCVSDTCEQF